MTNVVSIGSTDGRLCGELAAALARRLTAIPLRYGGTNDTESAPGTKGAACYHNSCAAFENAVSALTAIGVLVPVVRNDKPDETWYCLHALAMNADDMPNHFADVMAESDDRARDVLVAFLQIFCEYDHLPDCRSPFAAPRYLQAAMSMLMRKGYAEKIDDEFSWTASIAPAMQSAGRWDGDAVSRSELGQRDLAVNAQLALETMPETIRESVRSGRMNFIEFTRVFSLSWKNQRWHAYKLDDTAKAGINLRLAKRVFEFAAK